MSYRFMRVIVFFDLPTTTKSERREYAKFRKFDSVKKQKPPSGLVQMLTVTEKQFAKMEMIVGKSHSSVVDSDERLLIL